MERIYRVVFLGLFILGFVGAVASADLDQNGNPDQTSVVSLVKDVQLAQQINALNEGRWNQDVANNKEDGLSRVENLMETQDMVAPAGEPPLVPEDPSTRAKSELNE